MGNYNFIEQDQLASRQNEKIKRVAKDHSWWRGKKQAYKRLPNQNLEGGKLKAIKI